MSEVKKIQDYLAKNHNELFNDDLTEKQSINDLLFNLFSSEIKSDDKKGYIRKQKARYIQSYKINSFETQKNKVPELIQKNNEPLLNLVPESKDFNNVITLLQESLQSHSLQITELYNRITELEKNAKTPELIQSNELQSQIAKNDLLDTEKARYTFYITTSNIDYLKAFCKENNNISITSVINFMISQFKNNYPVKVPESKKAKKLF